MKKILIKILLEKVDNNYNDNIETINNEEKNNVYYSNKECNKNDNDNE